MTSNLGADVLASLPEGAPSASARSQVMEVVRHHFPPEFINRIDEIILFNRLSRANMSNIVNVQLKCKFLVVDTSLPLSSCFRYDGR
jgi:ATP-dependent Clp protease ATP-binding subunit ClpB